MSEKSSFLSLCEAFLIATDNRDPKVFALIEKVGNAITAEEQDTLGELYFGNDFDPQGELKYIVYASECFAAAAYRVSSEEELSQLVDVSLADDKTAESLRKRNAPNMANLVELARA